MSRKLADEALAAACRAGGCVNDEQCLASGREAREGRCGTCRDVYGAAIAARDAYLLAHGVKLTPREPTDEMCAAVADASVTAYQRSIYVLPGAVAKWQAGHDASDWPGDAP